MSFTLDSNDDVETAKWLRHIFQNVGDSMAIFPKSVDYPFKYYGLIFRSDNPAYADYLEHRYYLIRISRADDFYYVALDSNDQIDKIWRRIQEDVAFYDGEAHEE